ncbi:DNA-binding response regulator [Marinicauda pacifica]|jgi:two-component system, OmpR family, phosphate regulon response regulator OmpR|uniref:Response regulator transcription factor n=1 Tax=Marinicauda pacifica TaxID=1133559 RepID=A0A4S2HDY6_9PROT|nr:MULTISPECIES: response regulator transcription factor [Marinicauda]TGY93792.1 response regulator transcription factor [Marinicauda pacifica]GGE30324.1 DNA-binding response regulator [Marinicauda pacifica]
MNDARQSHILVVDDDDRIRELLTKFLRARGYRVSAAPQAAKALSMLRSLAFDLLILDVMMPGMDGFELTETVRETGDVPILLLTARGEPEDRIRGLTAGADDYLAKPFEPEELILRVQAILRRSLPRTQGPSRVVFGPWQLDLDTANLQREGERVRLTGGEGALLVTLAQSAGQPVSREALSEKAAAGAGERAVDVQITRLRRKIEADPKAPIWIQTVRGEGYKLVAEAVFDSGSGR